MTIRIKLVDLVNAELVLHQLSQQNLPFKTSYHIARLLRKADTDLKLFAEKRNALVVKFGNPLVDGSGAAVPGMYKVEPESENWPAYKAAVDEMYDLDIELEANVLPLEAMASLAWSPDKLVPILWLFEEQVTEADPKPAKTPLALALAPPSAA